MNILAAAGFGGMAAISAMSAPPMKDLGPAPVRIMASRLGWEEVSVWIVVGSAVRRWLFNALSFAGREIVMVATGLLEGRMVIDVVMVPLALLSPLPVLLSLPSLRFGMIVKALLSGEGVYLWGRLVILIYPQKMII